MNTTKETRMEQGVWVGIDWGHTEHAVSLVTAQADVIDQFRVPNTPAGYQTLDDRLARQQTVRGVAVEATRHALLLHLMAKQTTLYLINPKLSKAWRETDTVSGAKSDDRDGLALARGLAFRHADLRPAREGDPDFARLALLCEKECKCIDKRTALVLELESQLKVYYPGALWFFDNWARPASWDFIKRFPTPRTLARAKSETVIAFLKGHKIGYSKHWRERVETRNKVLDWPTHPQEEVYVIEALGIASELHALEGTLRKFRREIEGFFKTLPQAQIVASLPGAGRKLAPRLAAIAASPVAQEGGLLALRAHSGVAPVTVQSGKRKKVQIRRMCNKAWRNTMHLFAWCSTRSSRWARAFYQYRKSCRDTHSTILRKLADKWLKILLHLIETNQHYNEENHIKTLQRTNSPICQFIIHDDCG